MWRIRMPYENSNTEQEEVEKEYGSLAKLFDLEKFQFALYNIFVACYEV